MEEVAHPVIRAVPSNSSTGGCEGETGSVTPRASEEGHITWTADGGDTADETDSDSELGSERDENELLEDDEVNKIQEVAEYKVGKNSCVQNT